MPQRLFVLFGLLAVLVVSLSWSETGRVYVTGYTVSPEFPTTPGVFDTTHNGNSDVFVLKMMLSELSTRLFLPQVLVGE